VSNRDPSDGEAYGGSTRSSIEPVATIPEEGLPARLAPDKTLAPLMRLPGGTRVRVLGRLGAWASVRTPNGFVAWVDGRRLIESPPVTLEAFCAACGGTDERLNCPLSHDDSPASHDIGVGRVVSYRRRLRRRSAVVVGRSNVGRRHGYRLIEANRTGEIVRTKVRGDPLSDVASMIRSALLRLETLAENAKWAAGLSEWISDHRDELLATIGDRRLYAHAAVSVGDVERARSAGLPETEVTWLSMHAHRFSDRMHEAFEEAIRLPPDGYPDHALVLLEAISEDRELLDHPGFIAHLVDLDREFTGAQTLGVLVGGDPDVATAAAELDALAGTTVASEIERILRGRDHTASSAAAHTVRPSALDDTLWTRVATGAWVSATELGHVYEQYPSVADDLIDTGRVHGIDQVADVASTYLRARLNIESLAENELRELGAVGELARRFYEKRNTSALEALAAEAPEALYYLALDALRRGEVPADVPHDPLVRAVATSLESNEVHPEALVDPSAWSVLGDLITDEDAARHPDQAAIWHLEQVLADVLGWRFDSALERARVVLGMSDDESIRDEALNVIGFVLHQRGDDEPAITALEKALEDDYSANLQANIGIVAESLRPEIAAHHLAKLASEAPTLDLQLKAVRHAFGIWTASPNAWEEGAITVPEDLLSIMRTLVVADIPYSDYLRLIELLAGADDGWLAKDSNTDAGPHALSAARRVYVAKASHEPGDYVEALAAESKQGDPEEWLLSEMASFVESLRALIFANLGEAIGPASYAFAAIDAGLELDNFDYVTLSCGAAVSIFGAMVDEGGVPSDKVRDMIVEARRRAELLDKDDKERIQRLVDMASNGYGAVVGQFHAVLHDQIIDAVQPLSRQLYGISRYRIKWYEVERALRPMRDQAVDSAMEVRAATEFVTDPDLGQNLLNLAVGLDELVLKLDAPRSHF